MNQISKKLPDQSGVWIIKKREDSSHFYVYAEDPSDIESIFPDAQIIYEPEAYYPYYALLDENEVQLKLSDSIKQLHPLCFGHELNTREKQVWGINIGLIKKPSFLNEEILSEAYH